MECRWENFGIESRESREGLGLAIPATSSLQNFMLLSECHGPRAVSRLCLDSANVLNAAATLLFESWELSFQPDSPSKELGRLVELDITKLHRMTKRESVPDYVVTGEETVLRNLVSLHGPLSADLQRIAEGLEIGRPEAAMEIGFNLRNLQLVLEARGGRLLFHRDSEFLELPAVA